MAFGYLALFVSIYYILYSCGIITAIPNSVNLINWDANWYQSIRDKNYEYFWFMASNSAFFPLFSYCWKLLGLSSVGISVFNLFLFLVSLNLLYRTFSITQKQLLLYLSLPSVLFFGVPMSESFFFFFCTLFLIGLKKDNVYLIVFGLLFASLTRATAMFFIPCILAMELTTCEKLFDKQCLKNILLYSFVSLLGLFIVVLIQYAYTGVWFAFAKQQLRFWKHSFDLPTFPLVSHGGENTLWLDGTAFVMGFLFLFISIVLFFKKLINASRLNKDLLKDKSFFYSLYYVSVITVYALFFNSKCMEAQTTIDSISRYFFCTAFFVLAFTGIEKHLELSIKNYMIFLCVSLFGFYLIGLNGDPFHYFLKENSPLKLTYLLLAGMFVYINLFLFAGFNTKLSKITSVFILLVNVTVATYCLNRFIQGIYVG